MLPIRIKACSESDLRMLGDLAHNIQRVLPVTQADIDAAAALGQGWVVWKVVEVTDPLDNCRGGTQLVIKENSITAGQNVRRVLIVSGPGGQVVVVGPDKSPLLLPDAVADSLQYLKAYGDCENRNLPEGYQELEYIEGNSANQYINTGIVPTTSMEYYAKCAVLDRISNSFPVFGARATNGGNDGVGAFVGSGANTRIDSFFFTAGGVEYRWQLDNVNTYGDIYEITFKNSLQEIVKNGTSIGTKQYTPTTTCDKPLYVGSLNNGGSQQTGEWTYRFYRFTITGIADMRPARRLSDGVLGMYDTIRKRFFTNAGTGSFIAGAPLTLPEGYTRIEYIEGNNNAQYIDTGIVPTSSMNMYFKGQFVSVDASTPTQVSFLAGARDVGGQYGFFIQLAATNIGLDWFVVNGRWTENHTRANNDVVEMRVNNSLAQIWLNGTSVGTHQYTPDDTTQYPLFLNGLNSVGQPFSNFNSINRIYRFTIDGVADFVPARRDSDGAIGMFNVLNNQFYGNAGTGTFTAGGVITPSPTKPADIWCNNGAIKAIRPIKYLESTGTQYIDTGVLPKVGMKVEYEYSTPDIPSSNKFLFGSRSSGAVLTSTDQFYVAILNTSQEQLISGVDKTIIRDYQPNVYYKTIATNSSATANGTYNIVLFGFNVIGTINCAGSKRIKSFKIYDGNTLIRDFIAALDTNNIPCMFDKVEGKCYYNVGTGQFIAGYLPAEYEELEYIQGASNVQYINTGIIPNSSMSIYAKVQLVSDTETTASFFFGGRTQSTGGTGVAGMWTPTELVFDWFGSGNVDRYTVSATRTTGDVLEYTINNSLVTIKRNGTVAGTHQFTPTGTSTQPLFINGMNNGGTPVSNNSANVRVYRFIVAGVCDMIPARKRSNGHIGMYDLVRRQFFENAGEGQFTFGKLPVLPETYTQLEYLESTGTQWLETGVSIAGGCVIEAKAKVMENQFIIGSQVSGQPDTTRCRVYFDGTNQGLLAQKLNVTATLAPIADTSQPFEFKMDTIGTGFYFYVNGSLIYSNASSGTIGSQTNNGIKIAYNNATSTAYKQTVYWVKIYDSSNVLVRYLIPAKRNSDGVVGMYDIMNDVFLTNQGTGTFAYGAEIPTETFTGYYVDGVVEKVGTRSAGNKNLFNGVFEQGVVYNGNYTDTNIRIRTTKPIILPAGTYTVSCASAYELIFQINGVSENVWYQDKTLTLSATDQLMICARNKANPSGDILPTEPVNVQIEAGSTATAYVPYYDGGLAVCENLLGIGSTQDVQEILTGSITRKVGIKVLTGDEIWFKASNTTSLFGTRLCEGTIATAIAGLSTHFAGTDAGNVSMEDGTIKILTAASLAPGYISCYIKANLANDNLTTWMTWLRQQYDNGTPVIVVYPLSADETESVAGQTLTVSAGNNTAEIIQASIDDLLIEAKYTKSV